MTIYDTTPTPPVDYDQSKVPEPIKRRADYVRTKYKGADILEATAQNAEIAGIYAGEAKQLAEQTQIRQDAVEDFTTQSVAQMEVEKDAVIANATVDSEVILARGGKATLGQRLDDTTAQVAQTDNEIIQARGGKPTLKARLDDTTAQLAQKANQINLDISRGSISYGEIELPSNFPTIPFSLRRDLDGKIKHNFDLTQYDNGDVTFFVNPSGSNSNDGLTQETPLRTLGKALTLATSRAETNIVIKIMGSYLFDRLSITETPGTAIKLTNKRLTITTLNKDDRPRLGCAETYGVVWTLTAGQTKTYQTTRSSTCDVIDFTQANRDIYNIPKPYKRYETIAEVEANAGSYCYIDGIVYVHTLNGSMPDNDNVVVTVGVYSLMFELNNSTLVMKNLDVYNGGRYNGVRVYGNQASTFIYDNLKVYNSNYYNVGGDSSGNGITVDDLGRSYGFNTIIAYSNRDGFNYHYAGVPANQRRNCLAFEYNCISYENGVNSPETNNNATTSHDGACTLRVGFIGYKTRGPICSDVNGCYSILYDCHMRDSLLHPEYPDAVSNSAYRMDTSSAPTEVGNGVLMLFNCSGGGKVNHSLLVRGTVPTDITIQRFNSSGKLTGLENATILP